MKGFYNRILRIDVRKKDYSVESIGDEIFEKYLGGADTYQTEDHIQHLVARKTLITPRPV
jgi:aldehyde:ferredoxin oxidoreductase